MKTDRILYTLSLTVFSYGLSSPYAEAADKRPNIILFIVDDMGWQDTSVPFWNQVTPLNRRYHTPNMERLASKGVTFTSAYASPISSPSRCSLLTGANAARHRVTNWTFDRNVTTDVPDDALVPPAWNLNGITQVPGVENTFLATSFVELLRRSGYHTIHCGKAHWGAKDTPGESPMHFGFEVNIAGHAGGGPATYLSERNYGHNADGEAFSPFAVPDLRAYWQSSTFLTEALTREAITALQKAKSYGQPFFLNMAHYAVHIPIEKDLRFYDHYLERGLSEREAAYASLVEGMDKSLGDIMSWLERNGLEKETVILFVSDNGGYATGKEWRDEPLFTQNAPLRSGKGSLYEGGIRVPMIAYWPGVSTEGKRCDIPVMIEDFFPSILEMAGVSVPDLPQTVDGVSFVPLIKGWLVSERERSIIWNYPNVWGNTGPGISLKCAIRKGRWKLIFDYKTGEKELYDLSTDISENRNLASKHPEIVRSLSSELGRLLRNRGAQRPFFKATGEPVPWPDET